MKHPSDFLHSILHSMTSAELKHFSIHSRREKQKYHHQLMNAILKMPEYDEKKLKTKLKNWDRRMAFTKHYLQNSLLESLTKFHRESGIKMLLRGMTDRVEVLYLKGLHKQCQSIIEKAKKLAYKYEDFHCIMVLLNWELELLRIKNYSGKDALQKLSAIENEYKKIVECNDNMVQYAVLKGRIAAKGLTEGIMQKKESIAEHKKLLRMPLLASEKNAQSVHALHYLYLCRIICYNRLAESEKTYKNIQLLIKLIEENSHLIAEEPYLYINSLRYCAGCMYYMKRYNETLDFLHKMKPISAVLQKQNHYLVKDIEGLLLVMELAIHCYTGDFENAVTLVETENIFPFSTVDKEYELLMHYLAFYSYFGNENYKKAHKYLSIISNAPSERWGNLRQDVISISRIGWLVLHYEMKNYEILPSLVRSAQKFLQSKKHIFKLETLILDFMKSESLEKYKSEEFAVLQRKLKRLLKSEPSEKGAIELFDFMSWTESKIEGKKFSETVKRNYRKITAK